jgi:acetyl esterase/lipase
MWVIMKRACILVLCLFAGLTGGRGLAAEFQRTEDVVYGRKFGTALTLDVFHPRETNGCGLLLLVSFGYNSSHDQISPAVCKAYLRRGYTVFAVVHGSQPRFTIPEIQEDIHRAVRFVRHNAKSYGVDPKRLGMVGASAGGQLALTIATQGRVGDLSLNDVVERETSEVQCVACFFPPSDFLNFSHPGDDAVGVGRLKQFKAAFGPDADTAEGRQKLGKQISPIYHVRSNQPPVLIMHGDADKLVPIYQSQIFVKRCEEAGAKVKLIVREGKDHGWPGLDAEMNVFADWFDEHLRGLKPQPEDKSAKP